MSWVTFSYTRVECAGCDRYLFWMSPVTFSYTRVEWVGVRLVPVLDVLGDILIYKGGVCGVRSVPVLDVFGDILIYKGVR